MCLYLKIYIEKMNQEPNVKPLLDFKDGQENESDCEEINIGLGL